ncbi:VPLPA-CTERM sorting domain-containing protein [Salipiger mucosus]|uniref:Ice-binding protein C-terminal domain-containing protein n=1 Tax=Salipiger mucosus DSM 16094 TaxID=1123237 RepID=S9QGV0_9RHOB|nr:VPLPA-CTERM sorting domain-containing protein [Salipiger mucosus]EPX78848.1 hypothetical protein Salmuc_04431 [Salipiger mucosus DSM 16094]
MRVAVLVGVIATLSLTAGDADASVVIDITQTGSDVVATYSGSLDLSALAHDFTWSQTRGEISGDPLHFYSFDSAESGNYYGYLGEMTFASSGLIDTTTSSTTDASAIAGDNFGFHDHSDTMAGYGYVYVPEAYANGSQIDGSVTFAGATLASLGLNAGIFSDVASWGSGSTFDSISVNVSIAAVPLPASFPLALAGLGALGALRRSRRKARAERG